MATVSLLGRTINRIAGTKTVTATPAVNDLIVIVIYHSDPESWPNPTDNNSSGTYTVVGDPLELHNSRSVGIYIRNTKITSATSTVFTAPAPSVDTGGGLAVFKVTGMQRYGSSAVRQYAQKTVSLGFPGLSFSKNKLTQNPNIGAIICINDGSTIDPTTGYTEALDSTYSTPAIAYQAQYRNSGDTTNSMYWSGTIASNYIYGSMAGVELDTSPDNTNFFFMFGL